MKADEHPELDALIREHFEALEPVPTEFTGQIIAAQEHMERKPRRFVRYATAASLLLAGGLFLMSDRVWMPAGQQVALHSPDPVMQKAVTTTTLWRAPSDQFLHQTRPLVGLQRPARESFPMEELL